MLNAIDVHVIWHLVYICLYCNHTTSYLKKKKKNLLLKPLRHFDILRIRWVNICTQWFSVYQNAYIYDNSNIIVTILYCFFLVAATKLLKWHHFNFFVLNKSGNLSSHPLFPNSIAYTSISCFFFWCFSWITYAQLGNFARLVASKFTVTHTYLYILTTTKKARQNFDFGKVL